jgi:hypothetical protein
MINNVLEMGMANDQQSSRNGNDKGSARFLKWKWQMIRKVLEKGIASGP